MKPYKTGGVVISNSLSISKSFKDWICLQNLFFQLTEFFGCARSWSKILNNFLCVFSFTSTRFTTKDVNFSVRNQDRLVLFGVEHVMVSLVSDTVNMRCHFGSLSPLISSHCFISVNSNLLVWVDCDAEKSGVSLRLIFVMDIYEIWHISDSKIVYNRSLIQMS